MNNFSSKMELQYKSRNAGFDNLSGLFILYMVLFYHLSQFCDLENVRAFVILRNFFDCFMAWFFLKSGMFFNKDRSVRSTFEKGFVHLIIPFLVFNIIFFIVGGLFEDAPFVERVKVSIFQESTVWCAALWFLLSLFIVRISYSILVGKYRFNEWMICGLSVLSAIGMNVYSYHFVRDVFFSSWIPVTIPFWFGNVFLGLFFYSVGSLIKDKLIDNNPLVYLSAAVYFVHLFFPAYLDFRTNESSSYILSVFYDMSGAIFFSALFTSFFNTNIRFLTYIGRNSMIFYVVHFPFLKILFVIFENYGVSGWMSFVIAFPATVGFLALSDLLLRNRKIRWIVGG